jgi:hypothetical protein
LLNYLPQFLFVHDVLSFLSNYVCSNFILPEQQKSNPSSQSHSFKLFPFAEVKLHTIIEGPACIFRFGKRVLAWLV